MHLFFNQKIILQIKINTNAKTIKMYANMNPHLQFNISLLLNVFVDHQIKEQAIVQKSLQNHIQKI
jgi:hypothetical protein